MDWEERNKRLPNANVNVNPTGAEWHHTNGPNGYVHAPSDGARLHLQPPPPPRLPAPHYTTMLAAHAQFPGWDVKP